MKTNDEPPFNCTKEQNLLLKRISSMLDWTTGCCGSWTGGPPIDIIQNRNDMGCTQNCDSIFWFIQIVEILILIVACAAADRKQQFFFSRASQHAKYAIPLGARLPNPKPKQPWKLACTVRIRKETRGYIFKPLQMWFGLVLNVPFKQLT